MTGVTHFLISSFGWSLVSFSYFGLFSLGVRDVRVAVAELLLMFVLRSVDVLMC